MTIEEEEVFRSKSGTHYITYNHNVNMVMAYLGEIVDAEEYLNVNFVMGDKLAEYKTSKLYIDLSQLRNYTVRTRIAAAMQMPEAFLKKVPYFAVAFLKSNNFFENVAVGATIHSATKISSKFTGKMFNSKPEALEWLINFEIPAQYHLK